MRDSKQKHGVLWLLMLLALLLAIATTVGAQDQDTDAQKTEVLSSLEQRMQKTITLDACNLPIDTVIRQLAEQANVDVVISPKVTGNVNIGPLTDVPLAEALKNILSTHGYDYMVDKNIIRIVPAAEIEAVTERLVSKIYRITYADVTEVEKALQKFISKRGSLSSNAGTSNVIVTDTESKIKAIDTFIKEVDRITPQILVEARIYDITSKDRFDFGVEWFAGTNTTIPATGAPTGGNRDPFIVSGFVGTALNAESTEAAIRFGWLNQNIYTDFLLRAQQEDIDAKLLANPRVLVLDNEQAKIKIISEIPYQELTESAMGGAMGTTSFREVGVELEVTPHLTRGEMIRLRLKPKFSLVTGEVQLAGFGSGVFAQPVVDRREADTTLLIKDGQTVVLGGLRKKVATKQINKVPLLGDLPVVGLVFRFEGEDTTISELVVFITPHIVEQAPMSQTELRQYDVTEFDDPEPVSTRAEAPGE
jgi:type IV pilus assembly protein PilQ